MWQEQAGMADSEGHSYRQSNPAPLPSADLEDTEQLFTKCRIELSRSESLSSLLAVMQCHIEKFGFTDFQLLRVERGTKRRPLIIHSGLSLGRGSDAVWWHKNVLIQYLAIENPNPLLQSVIDEYIASAPFAIESIRRSQVYRRMARNTGFHEYFHVPVIASTGNSNLLLTVAIRGATAEHVRIYAKQNEAALFTLAQVVDLIGSYRFPEHFNFQRPIVAATVHPRPRLLLTVMARQDLTVEEAAAELGISASTAHKQIGAIRKALGVKTNFSAIHRAMQLKLLD